ncbi:MAG: hypothetical protein FJX47_16205 [Alphaproteobacteria bacterium]|nr:hypothetical protein [Alphaproteobacteria bacterium]
MIREGSIRIPFRYAAGTAGSRFLTVLRDQGRVLASHCPACGRVAVPLKGYCARCGSSEVVEIEVGPEGTLLSWTFRETGEAFGLVRLDGAETAMVHRLLFRPTAGAGQARVRLRLRPKGERKASILDIAGIEDLAGGAP